MDNMSPWEYIVRIHLSNYLSQTLQSELDLIETHFLKLYNGVESPLNTLYNILLEFEKATDIDAEFVL